MTKNSWQPLLCIIIQVFQVSTAGMGYYQMPKFFEVMVPMKMRDPHNAPLLMPAPAENIPQVLPADSPVLTLPEMPLPSLPVPESAQNLTNPLGLPPEIIPPSLNGNVSIHKFFMDILKDPSKGLATLAEEMSSLLRNRLPGNAFSAMHENTMDFTNVIDSVRTTLDKLGQSKECESGLTVIDHSLYTSKELISSINALHKLREMWKNVNVDSLVKCFVGPAALIPAATE